ncbi:MAG: DEAD/DEAH box helicase [Thermodesulfovibrionales bacterium]|nr:DEAD/DEAH box helicase [Thermodesulfovibrionales bacterium]
MDFSHFGFDARIEKSIDTLGFTEPTPIQKQGIPQVMDGHDLMGLAQTGTGKTAAFVLPILQRLITGSRRRIRALVISPTRELAEQTHDATMKLGAGTGLRSMVVYGGVNINPQKAIIRTGKAEIMVACPGRLLDHLDQGALNLSQVEILVLDEADRLMDMGFMPDIKRILKYLPPRRQTLMFSATMPPDIRKLSREVLTNPVTVQIGREAPAQNVSHVLFPVGRHLKTKLLRALLKETGGGSVLVFTRTRVSTSRIGQQLKRSGFHATSIEGSMTQGSRQAALDGFREGKHRVLVATDVAARGIDVEDISHVINYDLPDNLEDYIHRVGRTGRANKKGEAWSIVTSEDGPTVQSFEYELEVELVSRELDDFDYDAAAPPSKRHTKSPRSHQSHGKRHSTSDRGRRGRQKKDGSSKKSKS